MLNNDVLRSLRYILNINEQKIIAILKLVNCEINLEQLSSFLKKEDEQGFIECDPKILNYFLDGLIIHKRGRELDKPLMPLVPTLSNNLILKRLRVAFELKDDDIVEIFNNVGFTVSKTELSAFFLKEGHAKYRDCGDQFLRNFLKGLKLRKF